MSVCVCTHMCILSHVQFFVIHGLQLTKLLCPWDFPGKNTGVGCHLLLQGIFPTQGLNSHLLCFLHWQVDYSLLVPHEKPHKYIYSIFFWISFPFRSPQSIKQNSLSYIVGFHFIYFIHSISSGYMSIPISQLIPLLTPHLVSIRLLSTSVSLFLFYK